MSASWPPQEPTITEPTPLAPSRGIALGAVLSTGLCAAFLALVFVAPALLAHASRALLEGVALAAVGVTCCWLAWSFLRGGPGEGGTR